MNARAVAIDVLARVEATDAYLNLVLDQRLAEVPLPDPRDAALVTELCYGATRRRLGLDRVVSGFSDRKLAALEDRVLAALRIGSYQIFHSRVPRRAAVSETVEGLKQLGLSRAAGFVNAVLRKVAALESLPLPPESDPAEYLSVRESHPRWLVERWLRRHGAAGAEAMLVADNEPPPVTVRTNARLGTREALGALFAEAGLAASPTTRSPVGFRLQSSGPVEELIGFAEGRFQVQDEAAQLVGLYAAIPEGARVLDACAAPGGKACHLAETHPVLAVDLYPAKLEKIRSEARRLRLEDRVEVLAHDATEPFPPSIGPVEAVLLDAPCTGLGTLRRHPELRWRRQEPDLGRLATLQRRILERCQEVVPPGGLLIYAVCSTEPEEGQDQVDLFLRSHPDFTLETPPVAERLGWPLSQGALRTLPGPEGMDGFYAARLRRLA
ncbi:MAG TPA: 16S rRNA (cytosine(967)-C(5))-methyltransferase RsmB [Myxococcaceae bacterium]|nr:16S rRNA (cytosine(967)-C(5))-methyltransferase RsmB [Myxococcaceae bacterium]